VTELQAETDRMGERLDAVEASKTTAAPPDQRVAARTTEPVTRPKLKVVRVDPDGGEMADTTTAPDPESETSPRVVISGEGKAVETRTLPPQRTAKPAAEAPPKPATKPEPATKK
jgi:hypothetical protein